MEFLFHRHWYKVESIKSIEYTFFLAMFRKNKREVEITLPLLNSTLLTILIPFDFIRKGISS